MAFSKDRYPRVEPVVLQVAFCDRTTPDGADLLKKAFLFPRRIFRRSLLHFYATKIQLNLNSSTGEPCGLLRFASDKTIASNLNAPVYFAHPHCPWERYVSFPCTFMPSFKMANEHCLAQGYALAVFPEENKGHLHCSIPRRLPSKT